ncbi:serine/threonine-protein kinase [Streptomyces sp. NPDC127068]|uniref:serine/threonine-protein kinase n=1 Tax=Streptomyces sp. NPDC127068 TaxID=3347127 RepID=UPI00365D52AA
MGTEGDRAAVGTGAKSRLIGGRYLVRTRLGRGGMGVVWGAEDQLLGRPVAVKQLDSDPSLSDAEARRVRGRTLREARAVAGLRHPNVVVVHDVVEHEDDAYIVMELVTGGSLADRVAAHGPLPVAEAARIGIDLLGALSAAHATGVLHRDLKPDNVLLEAGSGRVVLTDFGVARVPGSRTLTEEGMFVGSPEYSAPERMSGGPSGPEADLWSLGVLLCAALTGRSPFRRDSISGILHAVVAEEIRPPAQAGPLLPAVRGLLERDPARRLGAVEAERLLRAGLVGAGSPGHALPTAGPRGLPVVPSPQSGGPRPSAPPPPAPSPGVPVPVSLSVPQGLPHAVPSGGPGSGVPSGARPASSIDDEPLLTASSTSAASSTASSAPARMPRGTVLVAVLVAAVAGAVVAGSVMLFGQGRHGDDSPVIAGPTVTETATASTGPVPADGADRPRADPAPRGGTGTATKGAAPTGAGPSPNPTVTVTRGTGAAGAPSGAASGAASAPAAVAPASTPRPRVPAGYQLVDDPAGFSLAVPNGFTRSRQGHWIGYASPGGEVRIQVRIGDRHPGGPVAALSEDHGRGKERRAEVTAAVHRGHPAARWELVTPAKPKRGGDRFAADFAWQDATRLTTVRVSAPGAWSGQARTHLATAVDTLTHR